MTITREPQPATFDADEQRLLIVLLSREGSASLDRGMNVTQMEFAARCFDLAAKVARTAGPASDEEDPA